MLELVERGLDVAERVEGLGPLGAMSLVWQALPQATKERVLGEVCELCDQPRSKCECCATCGFTPCACDVRFGFATANVVDVEGFTVE